MKRNLHNHTNNINLVNIDVEQVYFNGYEVSYRTGAVFRNVQNADVFVA